MWFNALCRKKIRICVTEFSNTSFVVNCFPSAKLRSDSAYLKVSATATPRVGSNSAIDGFSGGREGYTPGDQY